MVIYSDAVAAGRVPAETELKVRAAKTKFERALAAAITDSRGDTHAPAPPEVQRLANELLDLIRSATNAPGGSRSVIPAPLPSPVGRGRSANHVATSIACYSLSHLERVRVRGMA